MREEGEGEEVEGGGRRDEKKGGGVRGVRGEEG